MPTTIFSGDTGDGEVGRTVTRAQQLWGVLRADPLGNTVNDTANTMEVRNTRQAGGGGMMMTGPPIFFLIRCFLPFDTGSVIPAGAIIDSAVLSLNQSVNFTTGGRVNIYVTQGAQPDETNLTTADYNKYDALDGAAQGGPFWDSSFNGIKTSTFTATGRAWIKRAGEASNGGGSNGWTKILLRGQNDMFNVAPIIANSIRGRYNTAESANPPSLTVEWRPRRIAVLGIEASEVRIVELEGSFTATLSIEGSEVPLAELEGSEVPVAQIEASHVPLVGLEASEIQAFVVGSEVRIVTIEGSETVTLSMDASETPTKQLEASETQTLGILASEIPTLQLEGSEA